MKVASGQLHHVSRAMRRKPHGGRVREGDTSLVGGGWWVMANFQILHTQRCILVHFQGKKVFVWRSL